MSAELLVVVGCAVIALCGLIVAVAAARYMCRCRAPPSPCCEEGCQDCPDSIVPRNLLHTTHKGASEISLCDKGAGRSSNRLSPSDSRTGQSQPAGSRTQYKRVSIRATSSSDEEGGSAPPPASSRSLFTANPKKVGGMGGSTRSAEVFVETNPVSPVMTSGIAVQNAADTPQKFTFSVQDETGTATASSPQPSVGSSSASRTLASLIGQLRITVTHDSGTDQLTVAVHDLSSIAREATQLLGIGARVNLMVLPERKAKFKTGVAKGTNPTWNKTFSFVVPSQVDLLNTSVRFRLYATEMAIQRGVLVGQRTIRVEDVDLEFKQPFLVDLLKPSLSEQDEAFSEDDDSLTPAGPGGRKRGHSRSSSTSRPEDDDIPRSLDTRSQQPSILVGLAYNFNTGRLIVEIHRGNYFRGPSGSPPPDSFVTVSMSSKSERKTSVKKSNCSPVFMENFVFEVAMTQLTLCYVKVLVFVKQGKNKLKLGGVNLAINTSDETARNHWKQMMNSEGNTIVNWYNLRDL